MARKENPDPDQYKEIELPQSIIDSFARFLVPEIRKYYESEEGRQALTEWQARHDVKAQNEK